MARRNTTSGSDASGIGQRYSVPLIGGSGDSTKPWTLSWTFNLSGVDSTTYIQFIDKSDGASSGSGYGQGLSVAQRSTSTAWQNAIYIHLHDNSGSGWAHFRALEYRIQSAPAPLTGTYPFPIQGTTYTYTLVVDSASGVTDYGAADPADANYTTIDLYVSPEGGEAQTWTAHDDSAGASWNGTNGVFDEQVIAASASTNRALQGDLFSLASWVGRALSVEEIKSLHRGFSPLYFPRGLRFYNDQIRGFTNPTVAPDGLTVTDANATVQPHDARILLPQAALYFPPAYPAVTLSLSVIDADTVHAIDLTAGELLALPVIDADTVHAIDFVTGYTSPLVGIRNLLSTAIEGLTPPEDFGRAYVRAPSFVIPDGVAGHRMFAFEAASAGAILEFGSTNHQVEHDFTCRVRVATSTESLEYEFQDIVDEAMKLQSLMNRTSLATVSGADFCECTGYSIEDAENEDIDILLECRALTQETS